MSERGEGGSAKESEAVARMRRGDIGGLEVLVRRHQGRAVRAAHLIVGERPLAEDVVQDAFVRAFERIGSFDAERRFGPWFMRIVLNGAIDAASRGRRRTSREAPLDGALGAEGTAEPADREALPDELAERGDLRERVLEALSGLPPTQRAAVVQRYYLGMSEAEMAEGGSSPPGTIKWRLHAARKRLSELLRPPAPVAEAPAGLVGPDAPAAREAASAKEDIDGRT
jgi:RNA polymerase sigma-70 factor (ECF subfamily)